MFEEIEKKAMNDYLQECDSLADVNLYYDMFGHIRITQLKELIEEYTDSDSPFAEGIIKEAQESIRTIQLLRDL